MLYEVTFLPDQEETKKIISIESAAVERENLDPKEVRSSVAHCLGINNAGSAPADRNVESVVEMPLYGYSLARYSGTEGAWHPYPESRTGTEYKLQSSENSFGIIIRNYCN